MDRELDKYLKQLRDSQQLSVSPAEVKSLLSASTGAYIQPKGWFAHSNIYVMSTAVTSVVAGGTWLMVSLLGQPDQSMSVENQIPPQEEKIIPAEVESEADQAVGREDTVEFNEIIVEEEIEETIEVQEPAVTEPVQSPAVVDLSNLPDRSQDSIVEGQSLPLEDPVVAQEESEGLEGQPNSLEIKSNFTKEEVMQIAGKVESFGMKFSLLKLVHKRDKIKSIKFKISNGSRATITYSLSSSTFEAILIEFIYSEDDGVNGLKVKSK